MKDWEKNCYGMSEAEIDAMVEGSICQNPYDIAVSILSDCQELLALNPAGNAEAIRKRINVSKYLIMRDKMRKLEAMAAA